jgi:hypothetical protein
VKRFRLVTLFAALVLVMGASAVGLVGGWKASASGPLIVDSDGHASYGNCATSNTTNVFTTIQAAVNAASPGDLIQICGPPSGPYPGATVNKANLFLRGLNNPVITQSGTPGLDLQANGIRVEGITFSGNDVDGIGSHNNTSGHLIQYDTFTGNTMGIFLNSANSGSSTIVRNNTFDNNNLPGAAAGNGIYSDQGLHNAQITSNTFTHHDNAGVFIAQNPGTDNVLIRGNTFTDNDGNAVQFFNNVTLSTISSNTISNAAPNGGSSAIRLGGSGTHDDTISSNTITNPHFSGIAVRCNAPFGCAFKLTISSNTESGGVGSGIDVDSTAPGATTASSNRLSNNQTDGILYAAGTTGNKIQSNVASGNTNFDCEDQNGAGTTNTWTGDKGATASPPFICSP